MTRPLTPRYLTSPRGRPNGPAPDRRACLRAGAGLLAAACWPGAPVLAQPGGATATTAAPAAASAPARAPRLVASFSILADMLRNLAQAGAEVAALVGPDADAHVFEPTPADGRRLAQAELVLVNGLGFEGWIDRLVKVSGYRGTVVVASQGITPRLAGPGGQPEAKTGPGERPAGPAADRHAGHDHKGHHGHHHAGGADPHAWHDPAHARQYVRNISAALVARWPAQADELRRREADYLARIDALEARVRGWLAPVPRERRRVITGHDALGYFGAAYGIDFLAPRSWSTRSEPSAAAVARLVRQVREQRVQALFLENISDPRLVERIARETGARIGGTLFSDALSGPSGPAPTYLAMVEHNARTLAAALAG